MSEPKETPVNDDAMSFLEQQDKAYGKNTGTLNKESQPEKSKSLGQARQPETSTISGANDSFWKNIPIENLPSRGLFYPDGTEITIRSATTAEIRHWSTIDDLDMLDVSDKINFIFEKCLRIKASGSSWLSWRDVLDADRMFLIFAIHEKTFPNNENVLWTKFECKGACAEDKPYSTEVRTTSSLLQDLELPDEAMQYYNKEYKCFQIESAKLNETFYLYAPTIGAVEKVKNKIIDDRKKGKQIDKAFVKIAPYLIQDWNDFSDQSFADLKQQSLGWHMNKFAFINRFADLYNGAKSSSVYLECSNCGSKMESPLFLGSSFTIKSLFLVSGRLDELV